MFSTLYKLNLYSSPISQWLSAGVDDGETVFVIGWIAVLSFRRELRKIQEKASRFSARRMLMRGLVFEVLNDFLGSRTNSTQAILDHL